MPKMRARLNRWRQPQPLQHQNQTPVVRESAMDKNQRKENANLHQMLENNGKKQSMKKIVFISVIIIALVIGAYFFSGKEKNPKYNFFTAQKGDVKQEVSVTGRVKPAREVELAFEKSGKISRVYRQTGDKTMAGEILVTLENLDLRAQLLQAQANQQTEQAKLDELKKGTRPEELRAAETEVANAERSLQDAVTSQENIKKKAEVDLNNSYDAILTAAQKAVNAGKSALLSFTDIQYQYFIGTDPDSLDVADAKGVAVLSLLGAASAGRYTTNQLSTLDDGAFGATQIAVDNSSSENIDKAAADTVAALQEVEKTLHSMPITSSFTSTQKTNLETEKTTVNTEIANLSAKQQALAVQKVTNANAIAAAEASVNTAKNTLASAQDNLALKKAGAVPEQIIAQEAKVKSALANAQNYQAQLAKTILRSPFRGIVTKQNAKAGEIATSNSPLVSLISEAQYEIEANIPEADIAKVKLGDTAKVTLDAYGSETIFDAKITKMDPAETVIEGISTYKVTLQFIRSDSRLKSGLTANIDILTAKKENAVTIPQRALKQKNNDYFVLIPNGRKEPTEKKITIGLRGADGLVEVAEGLSEGEQIAAAAD